MGRGLVTVRILGIPVVLAPSWLLIAALITWSLQLSFQHQRPGATATATWLAAALGALLFFGSVLVHELSHSLVARHKRIPVRRIRLFIFGGVSELEHEPRSPGEEFAITIVGPLSSLAVGLGFLAIRQAFGEGLAGALFSWLGVVNLYLGGFNLLPGFPMDGGRVLRSIVWRRTGSLRTATRVAALTGRGQASLMVLFGLWAYVTRGPAGLWLAFIGWFLFQAATVAGSPAGQARSLRGLRVADLMEPTTTSVSPALPLDVFRATGPAGGRPAWYPVVDPWGKTVGVIETAAVAALAEDKIARMRVADAMRPVGPDDVVAPGTDIERLLSLQRDENRVFLVVEDGEPVGVLAVGEALDRAEGVR